VHQFNIRLVVGVERADVAPVTLRTGLHILERIGEGLQLVDRLGQDILPEIVD
jgi:hypothetical protein